jgi:murein endopeptidase
VRRAPLLLIILALAVSGALLAASRDDAPIAPRATPAPTRTAEPAPGATPAARPPARAEGAPWRGRLSHGRMLPASGPGYITWDPILKRVPNRSWRRWGTTRLLRTVERVLGAYARRHPGAPPVLVGDLSRPRGGDFGPRFGGIGHASHQNGLDVDVHYPRIDGRLRSATRPGLVDRAAAQALVDAFVRAGAEHVFVGPSLHLHGPPDVVQPLVHHDDHLHVRLPARPRNAKTPP